MSVLATRLVCSGCGAETAADAPRPWRCAKAKAGDDIAHVVTRLLDPARVPFPAAGPPNPFLHFRTMQHAWHLARARGMSDAVYGDIVQKLDDAVRKAHGRGFTATPFARCAELSDRLGFSSVGGVWVKDETRSPGGTHKARPLASLLLHQEVAERLGLVGDAPTLVAAGTGPSAREAAALARSVERPIEVYVSPHADSESVRRLQELGARVVACAEGRPAAEDPARRAWREALEAGGLPFSARGGDNGLAVEGAMTLAYEMIEVLRATGTVPDRIIVPVGAGTLAAACAQAMREAVAFELLPHLPRLHAVEVAGAFPLRRTWERVAARLLHQLEPAPVGLADGDHAVADFLRLRASSPEVRQELRRAAAHRSEYVDPPHGAEGPTGDEDPAANDDWLAAVRGLIESGGTPMRAGMQALTQAQGLAGECTRSEPHPAGAAAIAGLVTLVQRGVVSPDENVVVVLSGARR